MDRGRKGFSGRKRFFLGMIFLFIFIFLQAGMLRAGEMCPAEVKMGKFFSCEELCQYIASSIKPISDEEYWNRVRWKSGEVRAVKGLGYKNVSYCVCYLEGLTSAGNVAWTDTCYYTISRLNPIEMVLTGVFAKGNIVDNFVKAVLFLPVKVEGDSKLNAAFQMVQNLYLGALQEVSNKIALILLTMIFVFSLGKFGVTNLSQILRGDKQESWGVITSADLKNKALQVALALTFFMFPLPVSTVLNIDRSQFEAYRNEMVMPDTNSTAMILQQCGAEWDRYIEAQEDFSRCLREYQKGIQQIGEGEVYSETGKGVVSEPGTGVSGGGGNEITNWNDLFNELINVVSGFSEGDVGSMMNEIIGLFDEVGGTGSQYVSEATREQFASVVNGIAYCRSEWDAKKRAEEDLKACFLANGGSEEDWDSFLYGNIKNEKIPISLVPEEKRTKTFGIPLAIALVKGFVDYGVKLANKLSKKANVGLVNYMSVRMSEEAGILKTGVEALKTQTETDLNPQVVVSEGACSVSCDQITTEAGIQEVSQKHPECREFLERLRWACSRYKDQMEKIKDMNNIELKSRSAIREMLTEQVDSLERNFGWLSTGLIPFVGTMSPVLGWIQGKKDKGSIASLVKEDYISIYGLDDWDIGYYVSSGGGGSGSNGGEEGNSIEKWGFGEAKKVVASITDSPNAFLFGMLVGYAIIPPGSTIFASLRRITEEAGKGLLMAVSSIVGVLSTSWLGMLIGGGAGAVISAVTIKPISFGVALLLTGILVVMTVKMLPYLAIALAVVLRFLGYLFEIIKVVIVEPFFGVVTATTQRPGVAFKFFGEIVRLLGIPSLMVAGPIFAFFAMEVVEFFLYRVPLNLIYGAVGLNSIHKAFLMGMLTAGLYVFIKVISAGVGFSIMFSFPERVMELIEAVLDVRTSKSVVEVFRSPASRLMRGTMM